MIYNDSSFIAGFVTSSIVWASTVILFRYLYRYVEELEVAAEVYARRQREHSTSAHRLSQNIGELPKQLIQKLRKYGGKGRWPWDRMNSKRHRAGAGVDDFSLASNATAKNEKNEKVEEDPKSGLCIGSIFGLDVGGTLTKLIYFESVQASDMHNSNHAHYAFSTIHGNGDHSLHGTTSNGKHHHKRSYSSENLQDNNLPKLQNGNAVRTTTASAVQGVKKVASCLNLAHSFQHAEALKNFYKFAREHDHYGDTGVKEKHLTFYSRELGGELHFIRFETRAMENALNLIKSNGLHVNIKQMGATGGGAHKYASEWEDTFGIQMNKQEELECMVVGMQFVLSSVVGECYTFKPPKDKSNRDLNRSKSEEDYGPVDDWWWSRKVQRDAAQSNSTYPYLLVTIGTGVSILRIDGPRKYHRVSGSTIGGGTYWGLCRLLTSVETFEDVLDLAKKGDPTKIDMMVGDIYGSQNKEALEKLGLPANIVASSFGKLVAKNDPSAGIEERDLARALLLMITNNIGQVAYLNALLHKTPRIYFTGNFLRHNNLSERRLAYAIDYWSGGKMEALFLEHEGYFGSLGAYLLNQERKLNHDYVNGIQHDESFSNGFAQVLKNRFFRQNRPKTVSQS